MAIHLGWGGDLSAFARRAGICLILGALLACGGGGGSTAPATPAAPAVPAPVISAFTASPATVAPGQAATLSWTVTGATTLVVDHGVGAISGTTTMVTPSISSVYTLTASNASGSAVATASVQVVQPPVVPPPGITAFTAARNILTASGTTTLTPVFTGTGTLDPGIGPVTSGVPVSVAPAATTTYTLTVTGGAATVSSTQTVQVVPAPAITAFSATPAAIPIGGSSSLSATFMGGAGTLDHGLGALASGASVATGSLGASADFVLTVTNPAGDAATARVTVAVGPAVAITSFSAARPVITAGGSTTLTAGFANAAGASVDRGVGPVASGTPVMVTPEATTTYTLTAAGLGGPVSRAATVQVVPPAAIASFTAAASQVAPGAATYLTPVFSGGSGVIDPGVGAVTSGASVATGNLAAATTFTLTVTNPAGDAVTLPVSVGVDCILTYQAGPGGSVQGSLVQAVLPGGTGAAVTAVPVPGYHFTQWSDGSTANPRTDAATGSLSVTAAFGINTYTLAYLAGANGSLAGAAAQTVAYGASGAVVTAVPATGWHFTQWSDGSGANPRTDAPVSGNLSVTAAFAINTYSLAYTAGANGSLTGTASQTVAYGAGGSSVTAVPANGYAFVQWSDGSVANPRTDGPVSGNLAVSASFAIRTFTVTFAPGPGGTVAGTSAQTVAYGGSASLVQATPSGGYGFLGWTGTGGFTATAANPLTVANVTADMVITANFTSLYMVQFVAGANGSLSGTASQAVSAGAGTTQVTAVPATGYGFLNWTGTGGFVTTSANPLTVSGVNANMTITANFAHLPVINGFTALSSPIGKGFQANMSWPAMSYATSASIDNGVGAVSTGNAMAQAYPMVTTTYTLTAVNAVGSTTATVTFAVIQPPVITSFTASPVDLASGQATTLSWTVAGATTYTVNNGVGTVAGTSVSVTPPTGSTTYKLTAGNAYGGTATALVTVSSGPPVALAYGANPAVYTRTTAITADAPSNGGGPITSYAVAPSLPPGLVLNTSTGVITGTPTAVRAATPYTVTGTNAYGSTQATLTLTILDTVPVISYAAGTHALWLSVPISTLVPVNTGGAATTWAIAPALPPGLAFDTSTGIISGTPSATALALAYTVSATSSGGTGTAQVTLSVAVQPPAISVQPSGQILAPGAVPSFSVTASGTGGLFYQWYRGGAPIAGATSSTYSAPAFQATDDGTVFTVAVSDAFGGVTLSNPATLSALHDLATWLNANPAIATAIKWQFKSADPANFYLAPDDTSKIAWANWSPSQQADLNQAYLDAAAWYSGGMAPVTMLLGGPGLTDRPDNQYAFQGNDSGSVWEEVTPAYMWQLYTANVAFSLLLETSGQVPWSVKDYPASTLPWLFDSATMAWLTPTGLYWMGTYESAWVPTLRANNRARTSFADPRWTFRWLKQAGILGNTRLSTIGSTLDWMRQNLSHFYGSETFGNDAAIWQYRGWTPISEIVNGTIDANNPTLGVNHWTAGCHGSTAFVHAALRVLNVPVQPIWVGGHELMYFMSEDLYLDHGDDPYNQVVRASNAPSLDLLINSATWRARFGADETVNILSTSDPANAWIGYAAAHFQ